jgi:hypothetical protein
VGLNDCVIDSCSNGTAPGSVYCPGHLLAEQRKAAGVAEPEAEAAAAAAVSEDDRHPGMRKVYDPETGKASWIPVEVVTSAEHLARRVMAADIERIDQTPDPTTMEPHWDGTQWVLRPKMKKPEYPRTLENIRSLVRELMAEVGIEEADGDER